MSDIQKSMLRITTLEELALKSSPIQRLHPLVKVIVTIVYLTIIITFRPSQVSGLIPFVFYPILLMTIGELPWKPLMQRIGIALPFTLFTGISNVMFSRDVAFIIGTIGITDGMVSFASILIKTILTVMAVLILIATTSVNDLIYVMIRIKIPSLLVTQVMMTYRYIGVLLGEITIMYHAYLLRAPKQKGIKIKDMGPFLGQLIIRSFDRADRIYSAMKCRGFEGNVSFTKNNKILKKDWIYLVMVGGVLIGMRLVNISVAIGKLIL